MAIHVDFNDGYLYILFFASIEILRCGQSGTYDTICFQRLCVYLRSKI